MDGSVQLSPPRTAAVAGATELYVISIVSSPSTTPSAKTVIGNTNVEAADIPSYVPAGIVIDRLRAMV